MNDATSRTAGGREASAPWASTGPTLAEAWREAFPSGVPIGCVRTLSPGEGSGDVPPEPRSGLLFTLWACAAASLKCPECCGIRHERAPVGERCFCETATGGAL